MLQLKNSKRRMILCLVVLFLLGALWLLLQPKGEMVLWANSWRTSWLNDFFRYATWIGGGFGMVIIISLISFVNLRYFLTLAIINGVLGIVVQLLKRVVFDDYLRPVAWFSQQGIELEYINGFHPWHYYSFPSGHAASAFGLFITLAFLTKQNWRSVMLLICAMIVVFSRVYLGQHFFQDVYAGSAIGLFSILIILPLLKKQKWYSSPKLDGSFLSVVFSRKA